MNSLWEQVKEKIQEAQEVLDEGREEEINEILLEINELVEELERTYQPRPPQEDEQTVNLDYKGSWRCKKI